MNKPFSPACERNAQPIAEALADVFQDGARVLEIGSGTGQHAVHFGACFPHLTWQCSDVAQHHAGILAWLQEAALPNVLPPLELDVGVSAWPVGPFDAVFTANTCHIMAWHDVEFLLYGAAAVLREGGLLCVYGPFNEGGVFSGIGNALFDASLKSQAPHMGIRDIEAMGDIARRSGMTPTRDMPMPANNRLLVFCRNDRR